MAARSKLQTPLRLTDLPDEVVLDILSRLNIRDAARTSAVCRAWRHRWRHLSSLLFTSGDVAGANLASVAQSVLLRHLGQVQKFCLAAYAPPFPATDDPRLDDLLCHLTQSRHGLRELLLKVPSYKMHSSIFSCVKLARLFLNGCLLPNPTPGFTALPNLLELYVKYTPMLKSHLNSRQLDTLGALITGCPLLRKLNLIFEPDVPGLMLKISAPRLHNLVIVAWSADWIVKYCSPLPVLASAKLRLPLFRYVQEGGSNLLHVLQRISHVQKLELFDASRLDNFQDMVPFRISVTFEKLQCLSTDADLNCAPLIIFILHLIRSCPNLRELVIKCPSTRPSFQHHFEASEAFWNMHGHGNLFRSLRVMKLTDVHLSSSELHFIKFVLSEAEVLENLSIIHRVGHQHSSLEACIEILKFKRASRLAQIDYKTLSI
ncbi:unnamed protein product [Urochloa humidicola]